MQGKQAAIFFTISLVLTAVLLPVVAFRTPDGQKTNTLFHERPEEKTLHRLDAISPYEYGMKVGFIFNAQFKFLSTIVRIIDKTRIQNTFRDDQIQYIEQFFPFFAEELRGISKTTHIDVHTLLRLQSRLSSLLSSECTTALATGKATRNNETFLLFNMDSSVEDIRHILVSTLLHRLFSFKIWVVQICTMKYSYAFWGIPILLEYPFLNEKGVGWSSPGTIFTKNESRYIDEGPGMSTMLLEKLAMMTCENVSEVACLYKNTERASPKKETWCHQYDSSSSCFCDSDGGILCIEQTHQYILTVFGNSTEITGAPEGIIWHANHHQWLDPMRTGSVFPSEYPSSALRAERAYELLINQYGNITLEFCKLITSDHKGGFDVNGKDSGDICRHPDNTSSILTAFSWIIMPKQHMVYWTHTSPCEGIFFDYDFSEIFE